MPPAILLKTIQSRAVPGSAQKFMLTIWSIVAFAVMAVIAIIITVIKVTSRDYTFAGIWGFIIAMDLRELYLLMRQDNWFNNQWKKLKKSLKNFQTSL